MSNSITSQSVESINNNLIQLSKTIYNKVKLDKINFKVEQITKSINKLNGSINDLDFSKIKEMNSKLDESLNFITSNSLISLCSYSNTLKDNTDSLGDIYENLSESVKNIINACPESKYPIKCPFTMKPEGIVVHETFNNTTAMNEISYMITNNNYCSFHYAVDEKRAVQGIPLNRNAYHAGDGKNGRGNRKMIAIETCYSKSGGTNYKKAFDNTLTLVAQLMKKYGFTVNDIYYHKSFANKNCPNRALANGITLSKYRKLVQQRYNELYETIEQKHERLVKSNAKEYGMKVPTYIKKGQKFWISRYATFYGGADLGKEIPDKVLKATCFYTAKKGTLLKQKYKGKTYKFVLAKEINSYIRLDEIMIK